MLLLRMIYDGYKRYEAANREVLIDHYFLMGSPLKIIALTTLYWLFVMKFGPKWMSNRKPFDFKNTLLVYNALQVLFNAYLLYLSFKIVAYNPFYTDWSCMRRMRPVASFEEMHGCYCYFLLKVTDYMDTIFMVLRKRNRQITFLHVYHHILMVLACYHTARFSGGGHTVMIGFANALVHMIMYAYYFVSTQQPGLRNSIGWKKYITQMQLLQFVFLIFHSGRALFNSNCDESKITMFFTLCQSVLMVALFSDFYYKAYCRPLMKAKCDKEKK